MGVHSDRICPVDLEPQGMLLVGLRHVVVTKVDNYDVRIRELVQGVPMVFALGHVIVRVVRVLYAWVGSCKVRLPVVDDGLLLDATRGDIADKVSGKGPLDAVAYRQNSGNALCSERPT